MDTRNVAVELGKSREKAYVVGPVPGNETNVAQSLLDKQRNLASKPADPAVGKGPERDVDCPQQVYNRIHGSRALSPASITRELDLGVKQRESTRAETAKDKADGDGNYSAGR